MSTLQSSFNIISQRHLLTSSALVAGSFLSPRVVALVSVKPRSSFVALHTTENQTGTLSLSITLQRITALT